MPPAKSALEQLMECGTVIVIDSGSIELIKQFKPRDVTTNPSLLLQVAGSPEYSSLLDKAVAYALEHGKTDSQRVDMAIDKLFVLSGKEILKIVPGRVSTEIDARLSFDTEGSIARALQIIAYYKQEGIAKERILIKLASTWEGIKAAEILERDHGVHCNMTLMFNFEQAVACAEAGATLVSPFVGRIFDWHVKNTDKKKFSMLEDPGVISVTKIYKYYKTYGYKTEVMGASFRNTDQIKGLAGCDLLTIAPQLCADLSNDLGHVDVQLKFDKTQTIEPKPSKKLDEKTFRYAMNEDEMANDRLAHGIRNFAADSKKLEEILRKKILSQS